MKSIRNKLLTGIILINSLIIIGICFFKFGFEDFYINRTSKELNDFGKKVESLLIKEDSEELADYIYKHCDTGNMSVDIYDSKEELIFTSDNYKVNYNKGINSYSKKAIHKKNSCKITNQYKIDENLDAYVLLDKIQGIEFLSTITVAEDNSYTIITKTAISTIKNSVGIATNFLFMIFIPIIILSIIMAIYFSKKFTKPIIELNDVSNKIANLNFDEKVSIKTNDEIGVLGNSINLLSDKIKDNIQVLEAKNRELETLISHKTKQEKLKREFVSSVSHELKTPITVINGYAQGLKSNILDNEEDKAYYIDIICEESEKMGVMVNDLLDLYKLESNTFKIEKEKVNMKALIGNVCKKHELIIKEKAIELSLALEELYALGDRIRLEQVLNNLIDNAINHVDNKKEVSINLEEATEYIQIEVYNSGELIREEDLEKIWYSFVRLNKVRTSSENRIGLGLAIVREIVSLHGGEYGVLNKDCGVVFYIKLKKF